MGTRVIPKDIRFDLGSTEIPPGDDKFPIRLPMQLAQDELESLKANRLVLSVFGHIVFDTGFGKPVDPAPSFCFARKAESHDLWDRCSPVLNYTDAKDLEKQVHEQQQKGK